MNKIEFKNTHKIGVTSFSRNRKLTFKRLLLFMMMKGVKSLQNSLNEFFDKLTSDFETVSASAFSKARNKLSHKAFIELNKECILDPFYCDSDYKTYKGFRVLGMDGSKTYLPNTPELAGQFGKLELVNQNGYCGEYVSGLISVIYDVLNHFAIDSKLVRNDIYEGDLALEHLEYTLENDLIIGDRNYPSYILMAQIGQIGRNFLFRCSKGSFKAVQEMFTSELESKVVSLKVPQDQKKKCSTLNLPQIITVRLIKVILDNGEVEVLVTSLLDETKYPVEDFKELYWKRWGIETFYDTIKNRLNLENFTGKSIESVNQDFYSTIFVSNLETLMTGDTQEVLAQRSLNKKNPLKVNKAISFNVIKNKAIELFYNTEISLDELTVQMANLFEQRPTPVRKNRTFLRENNKPWKKLNYHKRRKKYSF